MKFVVYLSGRCKTLSFHQTQDSVAASVEVPKELQAQITSALIDRESLGEGVEELIFATKGTDKVPHVNQSELDDLLSDLLLLDPEDEENWHPFYADVHDRLVMNECCCGEIHIIKGRA